MLTVAVDAHRSTGHAVFHGLSVHTFQKRFSDVGVALPAGCGDIEVVNFGTRILRGQDAMTTVTVGAGCGSAISIRHSASMDALPVEFDGMGEWNVVPRQKLLIAVTGGASLREVFLGDQRGRVTGSLHLVDGSVAGDAIGRIGIAGGGSFSVYALLEFLHFIGMALRALCRRQLRGRSHFVSIAVAGLTSGVAESTMHAVGDM